MTAASYQRIGEPGIAHAKNFLDCIRSGRKPNADVDIALQGVLACHLARAAYWTGKPCVTRGYSCNR